MSSEASWFERPRTSASMEDMLSMNVMLSRPERRLDQTCLAMSTGNSSACPIIWRWPFRRQESTSA
eukprot:8872541-Heterocapsa_arctica.AAC.1